MFVIHVNSMIEGFVCATQIHPDQWWEDDIYERRPIDVVIPLGPKDTAMMDRVIRGARENIVGCRRIVVVGTTPIDGAEFVHENQAFPFTLADVARIHGSGDRNGWYFQQLIKLYAGECIPGLTEAYLVMDADTVFLRPVAFPGYATSTEHHQPYFAHMLRLHPTFTRAVPASGICHHMLLEKRVLQEIRALVEEHHPGKQFWEVFLEQVDVRETSLSGASEYELYFHYIMRVHSPRIRPLSFRNVKRVPEKEKNPTEDLVSCHWYLR